MTTTDLSGRWGKDEKELELLCFLSQVRAPVPSLDLVFGIGPLPLPLTLDLGLVLGPVSLPGICLFPCLFLRT